MNKKYINFIAVNLKTVISIVVSFGSVALITRTLGLEGYASIAVILSIASMISILGNSIVDACVKKVLALSNQNEWSEMGDYLSTGTSLIFMVFTAFIFTFYILFNFLGGFKAEYTFSFIFIFCLGCLFTLLGGVFSAGAFIKQQFYIQAGLQSISRFAYLLFIYVFLTYQAKDKWAVAYASLISSAIFAIAMYVDLKLSLPDIKIRFPHIQMQSIKTLVSNIGFMLLVYIGIFFSFNSLLIMGKHISIGDGILVGIALAISIGGIVYQILASFSYISTPKIHRYIANNDIELAYSVVKDTNTALLTSLVGGLIVIYYLGADLLSIWLGHDIASNQVAMITLGTLAFGLNGTAIQWSHFFSAIGQIRFYGLLTLLEGSAITLCAYILIKNPFHNFEYFLLMIPSVFFILKNMIIKFKLKLDLGFFLFNSDAFALASIMVASLLFVNLFIGNLYIQIIGSLAILGVCTIFSLKSIR